MVSNRIQALTKVQKMIPRTGSPWGAWWRMRCKFCEPMPICPRTKTGDDTILSAWAQEVLNQNLPRNSNANHCYSPTSLRPCTYQWTWSLDYVVKSPLCHILREQFTFTPQFTCMQSDFIDFTTRRIFIFWPWVSESFRELAVKTWCSGPPDWTIILLR